MQEQDSFDPPTRAGSASFGWFALGSLFGAVVLIASMVVVSKGTVVDAVFGSPESETAKLSAIRQAARDGVAQALGDGSIRAAASGAVAETAPTSPMGPQAPQAPAAKPPQALAIRAANVQGNPNAPVQIVEFSDFGCVFCTRFYQQTYSRVIDKYVKTGQASLVYKHFPIVSLHPGADLAAMASECAADQGQFWQYHNMLFERNTQGLNAGTLGQMASDLGLDVQKFNGCFTNGATASRMTADMAEARQLNVGGTPTFYINGQAVVGAQPFEVFDRAISQALAKKQ